MKLFITSLAIAILFASCSKKDDIKPNNGSTTTDTAANNPGTPAKLSADDSLHMATMNIGAQLVTTTVTGKNLILTLDENVDLLFSDNGYKKISAIHLFEDFKNSLLAGFEYTTVNEEGRTTNNWVDDNLNNVILKTISDTLINNQKMVKINVHRAFTFYKIYDSEKEATDAQQALLNKKDDTIIFSSYSYYNQKNYPNTSMAALLVYTKL